MLLLAVTSSPHVSFTVTAQPSLRCAEVRPLSMRFPVPVGSRIVSGRLTNPYHGATCRSRHTAGVRSSGWI